MIGYRWHRVVPRPYRLADAATVALLGAGAGLYLGLAIAEWWR